MEDKTFKEKIAPVLCNLCTFAVVFIIIPMIAKGVPDIIWISRRIIAAVFIAIWFGLKYPSMKRLEVTIWSLFQDFLAYIFRVPVAGLIGMSTVSALWEYEYIGQVYVWIMGVTLLQNIVIAFARHFTAK